MPEELRCFHVAAITQPLASDLQPKTGCHLRQLTETAAGVLQPAQHHGLGIKRPVQLGPALDEPRLSFYGLGGTTEHALQGSDNLWYTDHRGAPLTLGALAGPSV